MAGAGQNQASQAGSSCCLSSSHCLPAMAHHPRLHHHPKPLWPPGMLPSWMLGGGWAAAARSHASPPSSRPLALCSRQDIVALQPRPGRVELHGPAEFPGKAAWPFSLVPGLLRALTQLFSQSLFVWKDQWKLPQKLPWWQLPLTSLHLQNLPAETSRGSTPTAVVGPARPRARCLLMVGGEQRVMGTSQGWVDQLWALRGSQ